MSSPHPTPISIAMAPLRGVTVFGFREVFSKHFGGVDSAVAPFIPTVIGERIKPALLKDVVKLQQGAIRVIPQLIGKDPAQLTAMIRALQDLGHEEVNLNVGCPWKFVVKKGRGSGLMVDEDNFKRMLDAGCTALPKGFSIKVRLGIRGTDVLAKRIDLINAYPLREIIVHPRTAQQMYEGKVHLDAFAEVCDAFKMPVTYNGDIYTVDDFLYLRKRFPNLRRFMIGRGLVCNPMLAEKIIMQNVECRNNNAETMERLRKFYEDYYRHVKEELFGPASILGRMKEFWGYFHESFCDGEMLLRKIQRCKTFEEYERFVAEGFERTTVAQSIRSRLV